MREAEFEAFVSALLQVDPTNLHRPRKILEDKNPRDVAVEDRETVLARSQCAYCGIKEGPFEVDHIRALAKGGGNELGNLACACPNCNRRKSTLDWEPKF